jgi:hypothetical protein
MGHVPRETPPGGVGLLGCPFVGVGNLTQEEPPDEKGGGEGSGEGSGDDRDPRYENRVQGRCQSLPNVSHDGGREVGEGARVQHRADAGVVGQALRAPSAPGGRWSGPSLAVAGPAE